MYVIGLTGGIACGKSTVAKRLKEKYQAPLLDTDRIAWDMSAPGEPLWQSYVDRYGQEKALLPNGQLDREAIGKIVFSQPEERIWVDRMSHPLIKEEVRCRLKRCREAGQRVAVVDVPLLFEAGWEPLADEIWVVYVDEAGAAYRTQSASRGVGPAADRVANAAGGEKAARRRRH